MFAEVGQTYRGDAEARRKRGLKLPSPVLLFKNGGSNRATFQNRITARPGMFWKWRRLNVETA
jgi:hypothetical protein